MTLEKIAGEAVDEGDRLHRRDVELGPAEVWMRSRCRHCRWRACGRRDRISSCGPTPCVGNSPTRLKFRARHRRRPCPPRCRNRSRSRRAARHRVKMRHGRRNGDPRRLRLSPAGLVQSDRRRPRRCLAGGQRRPSLFEMGSKVMSWPRSGRSTACSNFPSSERIAAP